MPIEITQRECMFTKQLGQKEMVSKQKHLCCNMHNVCCVCCVVTATAAGVFMFAASSVDITISKLYKETFL